MDYRKHAKRRAIADLTKVMKNFLNWLEDDSFEKDISDPSVLERFSSGNVELSYKSTYGSNVGCEDLDAPIQLTSEMLGVFGEPSMSQVIHDASILRGYREYCKQSVYDTKKGE